MFFSFYTGVSYLTFFSTPVFPAVMPSAGVSVVAGIRPHMLHKAETEKRSTTLNRENQLPGGLPKPEIIYTCI